MMPARRWTVLAGLLALAFFASAILVQLVPGRTVSQSFSLASGGYLRAALGDEIILGSPCAGVVSLSAGSRAVYAARIAAPGGTTTWRSPAGDQYRLAAPAGCVVQVDVRHRVPGIDPIAAGLLFLAASLCALAFAALLLPQGIDRPYEPFPWLFAAIVTVAATALFLFVPSYYHADAAGEALRRNWGYDGAGYYDTIAELSRQLQSNGLAGLAQVESYGRPIVMPLLAFLFSFGRPPYVVGPLESAVLMALATSGLAVYARLVGGKSAGVAAGTLFALNPVVVAYSTSFYPECALLAGVAWAAVFGQLGIGRQSRGRLVAALACAAFAASSMGVFAVPLVVLSVSALLMAGGGAPARVFRFAVAVAGTSIVASIASRPFLWQDVVHRLPHAFAPPPGMPHPVLFAIPAGAEPLWAGLRSVARGFIGHLTPVEAVLLLASVILVGASRQKQMAWLFAGFVAVFAFTAALPGFAQQYVLYGVPFIVLLCVECFSVDSKEPASPPLLSRVRIAAIGAIALVAAGWNAVFYPYVGMAKLFCASPSCSLASFPAAEPVYGYKQAAAWLESHSSPGDVIVASAAPHVLQAYLPAQQVLARDAGLDALRPRFVVETPGSPTFALDAASASLELVQSVSARYGGVRIYRWLGDAERAPADLEASEIAGFLPDPRMRVVVIGAAVRDGRMLPGLIQIPLAGEPGAPGVTLENPGTGLVVVPDGPDAERMLAAHYARTGTIGAFGVYSPPESLAAGPTSEARWTSGDTLQSLVRSSPREPAGEFRLAVRTWNGARAPDAASAGCEAGKRIDVPLYRVSPDRAVAIFSRIDPIIRECLARGAPIAFETAKFTDSFGMASGQTVALRGASGAPLALRGAAVGQESARSEAPLTVTEPPQIAATPPVKVSPAPSDPNQVTAPAARAAPQIAVTPPVTVSPVPVDPNQVTAPATRAAPQSASTPVVGTAAAAPAPVTAASPVRETPRAALAPAVKVTAAAGALPLDGTPSTAHNAGPGIPPMSQAEAERRRQAWLEKRARLERESSERRAALLAGQQTPAPTGAAAAQELQRQAWLEKRAAWIAKREALEQQNAAERERKRQAWIAKRAQLEREAALNAARLEREEAEKRAAWIAKRDALQREEAEKRAAWIAKRDALKREQAAEHERKRQAWLKKQAELKKQSS